MALQMAAVSATIALIALCLTATTQANTRPDQLAALIALRDSSIRKGPGWVQGFNETQIGGQYVSGDQELGGPWVCPTDPQYSSPGQPCDPCGNNRPVPYWGNWNHVGCRGKNVTPDNTEGANRELGDGYVTNIHITGLHLEGTLPAREFCAFKYLREWDVDNANFTGQIPDLICSCFNNIQELDFSYNQLTGTLPECLSQMPWITSFKVENNYRLRGTIPASWAQAPNLWWIDLAYNQLSGSIPDSFITYNEERPLEILRLVNNSFSGNLYPLSRSQLQAVSLANNPGLCGMIPNVVRFAHGFNAYNTSLGKPCPGETYPPELPYARYDWPI